MVDEYLSEREQAEQLRQWFRQNWIWLVAGAALTLGGFYGWREWESRRAAHSVAAEARLAAMVDALAANRRDEGVTIAGEIASQYPDTPYADHAGLLLARLDVEAGDLAGARGRLAQIMESSDDPELRLVARLRLARVQLAEGQHDAALATLDGAGAPPVAARVEELRGDALLGKGDRAGALAAYRRAQAAAAGTGGRAAALVDAELLAMKIDELAAVAATE